RTAAVSAIRQPREHRLELRAHGVGRHALAESCYHREPDELSADCVRGTPHRRDAQRLPEALWAAGRERSGQHPDDLPLGVVDRHVAPNDGGIGVEPRAPQLLAEDYDPRSRLRLAVRKETAHHRPSAEDWKV